MKKCLLIALGAIILAQGCSSQTKDDTNRLTPNPVTGNVVFDGKAAEGVSVYLFPMNAPQPPEIPKNPTGTTDKEGNFKITTFAKDDGAPAGEYLIVLLWPVPGSETEKDNDRLQGWYDAKHTKYTLTVKPGENKVPTIQLKPVNGPPPETPGIPGRN